MKHVVGGGGGWIVWRAGRVHEVGVVAKSAFLDKGVVVEMDVVAGGSWKGMAVCRWNSGKGQPLGGIGITGKSNGKRDRWRR